MSINPFLNSERQLRNGWWILIFFLVLASILMPALLVAQQNSMLDVCGLRKTRWPKKHGTPNLSLVLLQIL